MYRRTALAPCILLAACTGSRSGEAGFDCCLIGILVMPDVLVVPEGGTVQLSATGLLDDRETIDLTATATWFSEDGAIASVSEGLDEEGLLQGLSVGTTEIYAAYRDIDSPSVSIQVTDAELQRHLIPLDLTLRTPDHYLDFVAARRGLLVEAINGYLDKWAPDFLTASSSAVDDNASTA